MFGRIGALEALGKEHDGDAEGDGTGYGQDCSALPEGRRPRRQNGNSHEARATDGHGNDMCDREHVAGFDEILARWRRGDEVQNGGGSERGAEPDKSGRRLFRARQPEQAIGRDGDGREWERFEPDRQTRGGCHGCDQGTDGLLAGDEKRIGDQERQHHLRVVMVNAARQELDDENDADDRLDKCSRQIRSGHQSARDADGKRQQRQYQEQWPDQGGDGRGIVAGERPGEEDKQRQRRIDEPRPMHAPAIGRVVAILRHVLPVLPIQQIQRGHHAHGIVAEQQDAVRPEGRVDHHQDRDAGPQQKDGGPHRNGALLRGGFGKRG